jgi:hypothetical protein
MQIIKSCINLLVVFCPLAGFAQSTYLTQGDKGTHFVDRLEIKQQRNTDLNFSTLKPFNRRYVVRQAEFLDSARLGYIDSSSGKDKFREWTDLELTKVDEFNLRSFLMNNAEWVTTPKEEFRSRKSIFNTFYKTKPNMLEVNSKDFFLAVNPMLQISQAVEPGYDQGIFLNSRGIMARGMIAKKIGFATSLVENQERGPQFYQRQVDSFRAVPGVGFYKRFKNTGVDYFDARGYITFNAAKYVDIQFGFDKNFIGNGYRSMFLSDWGNSYLFLKLNTKIWKFNYQNIFMELHPQFIKTSDTLLDRKYAAMHHLSINVTKWLNIGLFEGIVFGRRNRFDFQYLNPIIFYRHIEGSIGSPDNALLGFDFKANVAHKFQFYGQFLLDEFKLEKIRANTGWWANKWSLQLGAKYVDAFNVPNLDIQVESNRVRPFTYSHNNLVANYTHYNQPLAHPLGANFQELVAIVRYQPAPRWYVFARAIYYNQGLDSLNGRNFGANIFRRNTDRIGDFGYDLGSGRKATCLNAWINVAYEMRENLYFDLSFQYRNYKIQNDPGRSNTSLVTAGVRLNMFKRDYDF